MYPRTAPVALSRSVFASPEGSVALSLTPRAVSRARTQGVRLLISASETESFHFPAWTPRGPGDLFRPRSANVQSCRRPIANGTELPQLRGFSIIASHDFVVRRTKVWHERQFVAGDAVIECPDKIVNTLSGEPARFGAPATGSQRTTGSSSERTRHSTSGDAGMSSGGGDELDDLLPGQRARVEADLIEGALEPFGGPMPHPQRL